MYTIGIVGGLGPEASSWLYLYIVRKRVDETAHEGRAGYTMPCVVMWNVPATQGQIEVLEGRPGSDHDELARAICDAVRGLGAAGASIVGVACNTVHQFYDRYVHAQPGVSVLSIVDETVDYVVNALGCRRVGLLGSNATIKSGLYTEPLRRARVEVVLPSDETQTRVSEAINAICRHGDPRAQTAVIREAVLSLGVSEVILACTDLPLAVAQDDVPEVRIIPTLQILGDALIREAIERVKLSHERGGPQFL